ncbi:MAG: ComEC/Rec2 family competence protein [Candidatus Roizmanbacteria bacterium]|nr:ComEC/Rec2 family competence protein [Candidatus Roizmanbacteria bacterium]
MLEHFISTINSLLPEPQASLLAGMLFGVRRDMPEDFYSALISTGTLHVIALSGMNISIIIRLLIGVFMSMLGRVIGIVLTLLAIMGFVILVGASPTIIRASIMGSLSLIAMWFGRKDLPLLSLFFAVSIMLIINNDLISSISFQLSVFATLGIILFAGNSETANKFLVKNSPHPDTQYSLTVFLQKIWLMGTAFIKDDLRVTLSAQIFTAPLILFYFNRMSFISPIVNLATGWLVAPITYLGFMTVLLAQIWWPLGRLASLIVWVPLTLFIWIVETFSQVPFASIEFGS